MTSPKLESRRFNRVWLVLGIVALVAVLVIAASIVWAEVVPLDTREAVSAALRDWWVDLVRSIPE